MKLNIATGKTQRDGIWLAEGMHRHLVTQMDQQCHETLGKLITPGAGAASSASAPSSRSTVPALPPLRPGTPPPEAVESATGTISGRVQSAGEIGEAYVYLDGFALRVRSTGKVVSVPMLSVVGVLADAQAPCPLQVGWGTEIAASR